jgi:hypothetical protein
LARPGDIRKHRRQVHLDLAGLRLRAVHPLAVLADLAMQMGGATLQHDQPGVRSLEFPLCLGQACPQRRGQECQIMRFGAGGFAAQALRWRTAVRAKLCAGAKKPRPPNGRTWAISWHGLCDVLGMEPTPETLQVLLVLALLAWAAMPAEESEED